MRQENTHTDAAAAERVEFPSRRGNRIVGLWQAGAGRAAVILCHGMESSKAGVKSSRLAAEFAGAGCHALRFDFSYVGESEGCFEDLTVSGEVDDLAGAWAFTRKRFDGPVGIVGSSLGGAVAVLFAAQQPAVAALATIAAVAYPGRFARSLSGAERRRWRTEGVYEWNGIRLRSSFLDDVETIDVPGSARCIRCPVLLTHGTSDAVVPYTDAEALAGCVPDAEVRLYDGADHRFSDPAKVDRLLSDIADWMLRRLGVTEAGR